MFDLAKSQEWCGLKAKSKPSPLMPLDEMFVGLADAQRLIGKGETHVLMLVRTGLLPKAGRGRYRVADVAKAALQFRENEDRKSTQTEEAKRVQVARAKEIEFRTAKAQREVIPIDDVCYFLTDTIGVFRSELAGLPAACTREPELRATIDDNLARIIDRIRGRFDEGASRVLSRKQLILEDEEDGN